MTVTKITRGLEDMFIEFMIQDNTIFTRCLTLLDPGHFTEENKDVIAFMLEHYGTYNNVPTREQIEGQLAIKGVGAKDFDTSEPHQKEWFLDQFNDWVKFKNMEGAILGGAEELSKGNYDVIAQLIKEASEVGFQKDFGLDWREDPVARNKAIFDAKGQLSTGWSIVDEKLYGGFSRGELNFFLGKSGSGKSIFLANIARNWQQMGLNVLYVTLELSKELVAQRLDMIHMGYSTKQVNQNIETIATTLSLDRKDPAKGNLIIHEMAGLDTNTNNIKSFLKEFEIQHGYRFDAVIVDYMDIMIPNDKRVSPNNKFQVDEFISTELREMAKSEELLVVTASQMNRGGTEVEQGFEHYHIAGGLSKINSADNILAIITNPAMRERGEYKIQFIKTRNSPSTNHYVALKYDMASMRVSDFTDEELAQRSLELGYDEAGSPSATGSSVVASIKKKSNVKSGKSGGKSNEIADEVGMQERREKLGAVMDQFKTY